MFLKICLSSLLAAASALCTATEVSVASTANEVTIYHNGALVERNALVDLPAGTHELSFPSISAKCLLNSFKLDRAEISILNRSLVSKLSEERKQQLMDEKQSLADQLKLLEKKYEEPSFIKDVEELERMMALYTSRILEIKRKMRSVVESLEAEKALDNFEIDNPDAGILQLTVSVAKSIKGKLGMSYLVGGIGWGPSYDVIISDVAGGKIELRYSAKVMSQTGEDWNDVAMSLSSEFPLSAPKDLPAPNGPWILNEVRGGAALPNGLMQGTAKAYEWQASNDKALLNGAGIQDLKGVSYTTLRVPTFLEDRKLQGRFTLKSNSTVFTYPILNTTLPARFYYYGYPNMDPEAYLVAELSDWSSLGLMDGVANIRYKDNDAGRSNMKFSESTDTLMLAIGQDNNVFLKYEEIADEKYFKEVFASRKSQTTFAYRYVVKNNNSFPIEFKLLDQVPITQRKEDEVSVDKLSNGLHNKETGQITWVFILSEGEQTEKQLIYTVRTPERGRTVNPRFMPSNKRKQQYRGVSSPSFF